MGYNTPLTSDQLTLIRNKGYAGDYYVSFMSNRVIMYGTFSTDTSIPQSWAELTYTATSGVYTECKPQRVILVSKTNDITTATYRGRLRTTPSPTKIYCSESSLDFNGGYFWVIDTIDLKNRLSRPWVVGDVKTELVDWDTIYQTPYPVAKGLQTAYADWGDSTNSYKLRLDLDVSGSYHRDPNRTIASFHWQFYAGTYTYISGSATSPHIVVDITQGEQWGELLIVDDIGQNWTRYFAIKAHGPNYLPNVGLEDLAISGSVDGPWQFSASAFENVANFYDQTFTVVWRGTEKYGDTFIHIAPNNIAFVGWMQKEQDSLDGHPQQAVLSGTKFEFASIATRLQKIESQLLAFVLNSDPTLWRDEEDLTPWRGILKFLTDYTTLLYISDVEFDSGTGRNDTYIFPEITTQGGNALSVIQGICNQVKLTPEFTPDGKVNFNTSIEYLNTTDRAAITDIVVFDIQDIVFSPEGQGGISKSKDEDTYGIVDADGAYYNSTTTEVVEHTVRSPGHAQGDAPGRDTLSNQILPIDSGDIAALTELGNRSGCRFNIVNNTEFLDVDQPDGYCFIVPSKSQLYAWNISTTAVVSGQIQRIVYTSTTKWMVDSVNITPGRNGSAPIKVRYKKLPDYGEKGDDTTPPVPNETPDPVPDLGFPAFNFQFPGFTIPDIGLLPAQVPPSLLTGAITPNKGKGILATKDGNYLVVKSDTKAYLLIKFILLRKPKYRDITPTDLGSFKIKEILIDRPNVTKYKIPCYILASDGTNSAVWYSENVGILRPTWVKGAEVVDIYTRIEFTKTPGKILILTDHLTVTNWTHTFDFTINNQGWTVITDTSRFGCRVGGGVYVPGVAWEGNLMGACGGPPQYTSIAVQAPAFESTQIITYFSVYHCNGNSAFSHHNCFIWYGDDRTAFISEDTNCYNDENFGTVADVSRVGVILAAGFVGTDWQLFNVVLHGTGINPYASPIPGTIRMSSDHGLTFNVGVDTGGDTPKGFDVELAGDVSFVGCKDGVYHATTLGGSYSLYKACTGANVVCCHIPTDRIGFYDFDQTSESDPDVIIALSTVDSDGGCLYVIDGITGDKINITPPGMTGFSGGKCVTSYGGTHIEVYGTGSTGTELWVNKNSGDLSYWVKIVNLTSPHQLSKRISDRSFIKETGTIATITDILGQIFLAENGAIDYSSKMGYNWISSHYPRTMPVTGIDGFDVLG